MTERTIELFRALNTTRYGRSNLIAAFLGGSVQNRKRELGSLRHTGWLKSPAQQKETANYRYSPRIYELTNKAKAALRTAGVSVVNWEAEQEFKRELFWHRLMIADIVWLFKISSAKHGMRFRTKTDILGSKPLSLPCQIEFPLSGGRTVPYNRDLRPDELLAIDDTFLVIEADRGSERIKSSSADVSSYQRKLLQYRHVYVNRLYQKLWGIQTLFTLHVTLSHEHSQNIMQFMDEDLQAKSRGQLFAAFPILGATDAYPTPIDLLEHPFKRVGYDPLIIGKEIIDGRYRTAATTV
jgi:hypothetical protein